MKKAKKLNKSERLEIEILLNKEYSQRQIAKVLDRSPNTISYEINKNSVNDKYNALKADHKSYVKKKYSKFEWKKINKDNKLREYIIKKLKSHWNPEEIAGRMKLENKSFYASKSSIYDWLRTHRGQRYCKYLYSKRYYKRKREKKVKRSIIPFRIGIEYRLNGANNRSRFGHCEVDTIVSGKNGSGAVSVMVDRKSRYIIIKKLNSMKAQEHENILKENIKRLKIKSLTFDNGIENKYHYKLNVSTFFCNPYSSYEKGSVENVNKMIRKFIPKGSDISKISQKTLDKIGKIINEKPRKILGFRSALEIALEAGIIKSRVS